MESITKSPRPRNPPRQPPDYLHLRCPQCEAPMAPESSLVGRLFCWQPKKKWRSPLWEMFQVEMRYSRNWENTWDSYIPKHLKCFCLKSCLGSNVVQQFAHEIDGGTKFHIMHGMLPFNSVTSSVEPAEGLYPSSIVLLVFTKSIYIFIKTLYPKSTACKNWTRKIHGYDGFVLRIYRSQLRQPTAPPIIRWWWQPVAKHAPKHSSLNVCCSAPAAGESKQMAGGVDPTCILKPTKRANKHEYINLSLLLFWDYWEWYLSNIYQNRGFEKNVNNPNNGLV